MFCSLALLTLAACTDYRAAQEPLAPNGYETLGEEFAAIAQRAIDNAAVEGLVFALIEDDAVSGIGALGLADRESSRRMTIDTPINVASISKSFTAWGTIVSARRADVGLDVPLAEHIDSEPFYRDAFGDAEATLRTLLTHTSGLSGSSVPVTPATEAMPSIEDVFRGRSTVPAPTRAATSDGSFSYSGAGYLLLQYFIENASNQRFATFMQETVFEPLGMRDSTFAPDAELFGHSAVYYRRDGRRREPYHLPGAAGGLYSTATDMARFIRSYTEPDGGTRRRILSETDFSSMLTASATVTEDAGRELNYGFGHYVYTTPDRVRVVFHAGGNPGLRALFAVAPDRRTGFFAAANDDRGNAVLGELHAAWGRRHGLTLPSPF